MNVDLLDGGFNDPASQGLSTPRPNIDEDLKRYIYSQAKKMYPNSHTKVMDINSGSGRAGERNNID